MSREQHPDRPSWRLSDTWKGTMAAGVVVCFWSGFNIVSRFGSTGAFTPFDLAALRFGISGLIALPFVLRWTSPSEWPRYAWVSAFGGLGYALLVYSGFAFAPSAHAGVFVNGGIPFWTAILLAVTSGVRLAGKTLTALLLTTSGLVLIGSESLFATKRGDEWLGDLLFLAAALSWAVFGLLMRRWRLRPQPAIFAIASLSAAAYLPVYWLALPKTIQHAPWDALLLQGVYQGIIAALLAGGLYSYANQKIGASRASMALAVVPAVSAIAAYLLLDEPISLAVGAGIVIVTAGAVLGTLSPASAGGSQS
ncbi:MAG: DMT family transporter [Betaproteobacteria bacterium]|nr:MAG: DMT family transporter [Betaproteobacteria bacterium]